MGITKPDANDRWKLVAADLVPVQGDRKGYVLQDDLDALERPPAPEGVRLIPAKDACIQARDREVLFPEPAHRKAVSPTIGGPGVVLHEAMPVGTWRGAAKGTGYEVTVQPFARFTKGVWAEVEGEAERVARARGRASARVVEAALVV